MKNRAGLKLLLSHMKKYINWNPRMTIFDGLAANFVDNCVFHQPGPLGRVGQVGAMYVYVCMYVCIFCPLSMFHSLAERVGVSRVHDFFCGIWDTFPFL